MNIIVNGQSGDYPAGTNISTLLTLIDIGEQRIALEINKEIISRSAYDSTILNEGDTVEVIQAIGGG